jgi:hypothetical protein
VRSAIHRITGTEPELPTPRWTTRYGSPTRIADTYRRGRVLLAGDAAHPHPPSSGNGLNTALHDSLNLGWKLAATLRGDAPPGLLDTYQAERHPVGRRACLRALAQVPLLYPPDRAKPLRELFTELIGVEEVNRRLVQAVTRVRYPLEGPDPAEPPHPLLGHPLPDTELDTPGGTVRPAALLHGGHGLLLSLGGTEPPDLSPWQDRLRVVRAAPDKELDAHWLLVRPDGHVAWADAGRRDAPALLAAVRRWFG